MTLTNVRSLHNAQPPLSLMIVEDERMTGMMAAHHLKQFGTVFFTSNPREAVANYMVHKPDMVFLDIHYCNAVDDGFDILQNLLSADTDAYVVMVSGDKDPDTLSRAQESGAQGFIAKPFSAIDFSYYLNQFRTRKKRTGETG